MNRVIKEVLRFAGLASVLFVAGCVDTLGVPEPTPEQAARAATPWPADLKADYIPFALAQKIARVCPATMEMNPGPAEETALRFRTEGLKRGIVTNGQFRRQNIVPEGEVRDWALDYLNGRGVPGTSNDAFCGALHAEITDKTVVGKYLKRI